MAKSTQSFINVKLHYLQTRVLLIDTTTSGVSVTDIKMWNMIITFTPIIAPVNSKKISKYYTPISEITLYKQ